MTFKTHDLPQKYRATKAVKIMFSILGAMWALILVASTVLITLETHKFLPAFCVVILPFLFIGGLWAIILYDMKRAFVEITDEKIKTVDYYFGIQRENVFFIKDILTAEITTDYAVRTRGYSFHGKGFYDLKYIVFRGDKGKYLFKLIFSEDARGYLERYFELKNT